MRNSFLPFHVPEISEEDIAAVAGALRSGWVTAGPQVKDFEAQFARYTGAEHAIAVNSGTAALHLALEAAGIKASDEVLVPAMTFAATAEVVVQLGARPVLVDCTPDTLNIDPAAIERAVTPRTRAIIPVHFAGHPCDMDAIMQIAAARRLTVVEDAAHALPARWRGRMVGTIGDLTCFSFYATKTITTGEGGMITTNDDKYAERIALMRLHGIGRDAWKRYAKTGSWFYEVQEAGYKMNLPDMLAALGVAQLKKANQFWQQRREIAAYYQEKLAGFEELQLPPGESGGDDHAWHLFILRLRPELLSITRNELIEELKADGIGTSVHFIPLHRHPYYVRTYGCTPSDFPQADCSYLRCVSLPIFPGLTEEQREHIVQSVTKLVAKNRKRTAVAAE